MELPIINCIGVTFGEIKILDIHVAFDCEQVACSVFVQKSNLLVTVYYHEMRSTKIKAQVSDSIACEWFDDTETVHVFVHAMKIPQSYVIVESTCGHSMSLGFYDATGDCLFVSIEGRECVDGDSEFVPSLIAFFLVGLYFCWFLFVLIIVFF